MGTDAATSIAELGPRDAWNLLSDDPDARLIDVRSAAEWGFVGTPDLSPIGHDLLQIEWQSWPGMARRATFADKVAEAAGEAPGTLLFLCRSGARSRAAAAATAALYAGRGTEARCVNVAEGFEGDLDEEGRRGRKNGWKAKGLPWRQT